MNKRLYAVNTIIAIFTLILMAFSASAFEDFTAVSFRSDIPACACGVDPVDVITVTNTGDIISDYKVDLEGKATSWTTIVPEAFQLKPGESIQISTFATPGCKVRGDYSLEVSISTITKLTKVLEQEVTVRNCKNIAVEVEEWSKKNYPCVATDYKLDITNTGSFIEHYSLSTFDEGGWVVLGEDELILNPGETQTVSAFVEGPCDAYGIHDFGIIIDTRYTEFEALVPIRLDVEHYYNYDLEAGDYIDVKSVDEDNNTLINRSFIDDLDNSYNICEKEFKSIPFQITNEVYFANAYDLELQGPKIGELYADSIALAAGQSGSVDLDVHPGFREMGNYSFTVESISRRGNLYDNESIDVFVRKCFDMNMEILIEDPNICGCEETKHTVYLHNYGEFDEKVLLKLSGGKFATLSDFEPIVPASSTATVDLILNSPCEERNNEKYKIYAELVSEPRVNAEVEFKLYYVPVDVCYDTSIDTDKVKLQAEDHSISLSNLGLREVDYKMSVIGPAWATLAASDITLKTGEQGSINMLFRPEEGVVEGFYPVEFKAIANEKVLFSKEIILQVGEDSIKHYIYYYRWFIILASIILITILVVLAKSIRAKTRKYWKEEWIDIEKGKKVVMDIEKNMAITEVSFTSKKVLKNTKLSVEQLKKCPVRQEAADYVYAYSDISKSNLNDIKDIMIKFKIEKKWLEKNNLKQSDISMRRYEGGWRELPVRKAGSDAKYIYFKAAAKNFSYFAVVSKAKKLEEAPKEPFLKVESVAAPKKESKKEQKNYKPLIIVSSILLIAIIALAAIFMINPSFEANETADEEEAEELAALKEAQEEEKQKEFLEKTLVESVEEAEVVEAETEEEADGFMQFYLNYIIAGVVILVVLIIGISLASEGKLKKAGNAVVDFFLEEEAPKKKK